MTQLTPFLSVQFGLLYAGAQKNVGCAGVTIVIGTNEKYMLFEKFSTTDFCGASFEKLLKF